MIIVDVHEPKSVLSLLKRKGLDFERNFLEVGDYILPDGIAIERKRGDDFLHSIIDGRLWVQANNLTQYDVPIFCVVSNNMWKDMYFNKSRHIHKAYYGALATLISKFSIPTVNFSSDEDFVDFICYLYSKILSDKKSTRPVMRLAGFPVSAKIDKKCNVNYCKNTNEKNIKKTIEQIKERFL